MARAAPFGGAARGLSIT